MSSDTMKCVEHDAVQRGGEFGHRTLRSVVQGRGWFPILASSYGNGHLTGGRVATVLTVEAHQREEVGSVDGLVLEEGSDDPIELVAVCAQQLSGTLLGARSSPARPRRSLAASPPRSARTRPSGLDSAAVSAKPIGPSRALAESRTMRVARSVAPARSLAAPDDASPSTSSSAARPPSRTASESLR